MLCLPPRDLPHSGIGPESLTSPELAGGLFTTCRLGSPVQTESQERTPGHLPHSLLPPATEAPGSSPSLLPLWLLLSLNRNTDRTAVLPEAAQPKLTLTTLQPAKAESFQVHMELIKTQCRLDRKTSFSRFRSQDH